MSRSYEWHSFGKLFLNISFLPQDEEVGDGTTSVVIVAAELLKNADELVKQKIHPTSIIAGRVGLIFKFLGISTVNYLLQIR